MLNRIHLPFKRSRLKSKSGAKSDGTNGEDTARDTSTRDGSGDKNSDELMLTNGSDNKKKVRFGMKLRNFRKNFHLMKQRGNQSEKSEPTDDSLDAPADRPMIPKSGSDKETWLHKYSDHRDAYNGIEYLDCATSTIRSRHIHFSDKLSDPLDSDPALFNNRSNSSTEFLKVDRQERMELKWFVNRLIKNRDTDMSSWDTSEGPFNQEEEREVDVEVEVETDGEGLSGHAQIKRCPNESLCNTVSNDWASGDSLHLQTTREWNHSDKDHTEMNQFQIIREKLNHMYNDTYQVTTNYLSRIYDSDSFKKLQMYKQNSIVDVHLEKRLKKGNVELYTLHQESDEDPVPSDSDEGIVDSLCGYIILVMTCTNLIDFS